MKYFLFLRNTSLDGYDMYKWLSIRPGRNKAGSIKSGLDEAARIKTYLSGTTPSLICNIKI